MGLSGMMRTSGSGMAAQSNRLSAVADNIANVSTTGYKRAYTEFSSFIPTQATSEYTSGSVNTDIRRAITEQGSFRYTTSATDLAINGDGFMLVGDENDGVFLTRAGSFVKDGEGELINAAGFKLMGYPLDENGNPPSIANSTSGLVPINLSSLSLQAVPSTAGTFFTNLPADAPIVAPDTPSGNAATAAFTNKTSLVAFANLGREVTLDIYTTKTADDTWELTVFDAAEATTPGGPFPYAAGPLVTTTLTFDGTTGGFAPASPTSVTIPVPDGSNLVLDLSQTSQLAAAYTVIEAKVNGNAPSAVDRVEINDQGVVSAVYENGTRVASYQVPLATVPSPDRLLGLPGDVFQASDDSGDLLIGFAGSGSFGLVQSSSLEQSTVDLASELTLMIEAEKNFQVNSKVFQTGADLLDVVVNLKR
jgi:flagellar hook protein FlgE